MRVLVVASTFPASKDDPVPAFVREQIEALKNYKSDLEFSVLAPYDYRSNSPKYAQHGSYDEYRFQYIWPKRFSLLTGRGIVPSVRKNKLLALLIPFFLIFEFISLLKLVKKLRPDVIYAHWFTPQAIIGALVAKFTKTKLVHTTHSTDIVILKYVPFHKKLINFVMTKTYRWTAVSENTINKTKSVISAESWKEYRTNLKMIPMGVNLKSINSYSVDLVSPGIKKLSQEDYIFFIGRLAEIKGVDILIKAFSELEAKNTNLVIAGEGPDKSHLEDLAKEAGVSDRVHFVGYVYADDKKYLLKNASVLAISSIKDSGGHTEGLPVVLMEALAVGQIIVASDESSSQYVLTNATNGFLYKGKQTDDLTKSLDTALRLTAGDREKMSESARSLSKQFDWLNVAKQHYDFLFRGASAK